MLQGACHRVVHGGKAYNEADETVPTQAQRGLCCMFAHTVNIHIWNGPPDCSCRPWQTLPVRLHLAASSDICALQIVRMQWQQD